MLLRSLAILALAGAVAASGMSHELRPNVIWRVAGGIPLLADLFLPEGPGPHPAILFIHGGAWHAGDKLTFLPWAAHFADLGYVCLSIDYRLAPFFRFPAQLEDVRCALSWLWEHASDYGVDTSRVAVAGDSAGGHLAALVALAPAPGECRGGVQVAAVVSLYGPMDLTLYADDPDAAPVVADFLGATYQEDPELWRRASPITWVRPGAPPFLLIHGEADTVVPVEHSLAMARALRAAGDEAEVMLVPGAGHEFHVLPGEDSLAARDRMEEFLTRVLAPSRRGG